jgi:hypothetical protein
MTRKKESFKSTASSRRAKQVAEQWIRQMDARGLSEREIARRGLLSRATVWNVLNPDAGRGGIKEERAEAIRNYLHKDQTMMLLRPKISEPGTGYSVPVEPLNARERKKIHEFWAAVGLAREKNDWSGLKKFRGKTVRVLDRGKPSSLKLMDDRDVAVFKDLQDKNLLAPKDGYTRYHHNRAPGSELPPIAEQAPYQRSLPAGPSSEAAP